MMAVLTILIAIIVLLSTWHLVLAVLPLLLGGQLDPANPDVLQVIFSARPSQ